MQKGLSGYVLLFFLSIYLFTAQGHLGYQKDGWLRFLLAKNIVEKGILYFDDQTVIQECKGWMLKGKDNRDYVYHEIGHSLFFIPFYITGKAVAQFFPVSERMEIIKLICTFLNPLLAALLCLVFMQLIRQLGYSGEVSFFTTLIFGLGTMVWPESRDTFNHLQAALFIIAAFLFILKSKFFLSGLCFTFSFLTRYDAVLALPAIIILIIYSLKKSQQDKVKKFYNLVVFFSIVFLGVLFSAWYNYIRFDRILAPRMLVLAAKSFSYPLHLGMATFLFSPARSLFIYNPVLLLAVFYLRAFYSRHKPLALAFCLIALTYILFFSRVPRLYYSNFGWGPRFIFMAIPLTIISLGELVKSFKGFSRNKKALIIFIIILSIFIQVVAVSTFYVRYYTEASAGKFPFKSGEEGVWSLRYSPVPMQFAYFPKIFINTFKGHNFEFEVSDKNPDLCLRRSVFFNVLDWWWVLVYFKGIKSVLFVPIVLIAIMTFSLLRIMNKLEAV